jgi:hypothetical protein
MMRCFNLIEVYNKNIAIFFALKKGSQVLLYEVCPNRLNRGEEDGLGVYRIYELVFES